MSHPAGGPKPVDAQGSPGATISSLYIHVLAFCSGMSIMAVELCASRLVAPYFGTSTFVWTNIIGVIMIALSVGYVVGGRLSDRRTDLRLLLKLLLGACAYLMALPFLGPPLLRGLSGALVGLQSSFSFIFTGSLLGILLLFAPPVVIMGMTSPFLIRILAQHDRVGTSAGRIFGISTIGSVLGTFLPVLVFIPTVGTGKTILIFAGLLLVVVVLGFGIRRRAVLTCLVAAPFFIPLPSARHTPGRVYAGDSAYQYIEVYDRGSFRYLTYNDALGFQTVANKASPFTGLYYDYYALLPQLLDHPAKRALIIGLGGGVIANQFRYFHPGIQVDGVEIDPEVIRIARDYFGLGGTTRVYDQDGRIFASRSRASYDVVIIDAYTQQIYVPFHLTTQEFFRQVKDRLADGGLVAMNVSSARDDAPLMSSICATLRTVFPNVYRLRIPGSNDNVVLATDASLDFQLPFDSYEGPLQVMAQQCASGFREAVVAADTRPLTDDWAPVEHMVDWELLARRARP
jgi:spermidine synthase